MSKLWTIRPLCFGEFLAVEKSVLTYGRGFGEKVAAPCFGWLLQSDEQTILFDTGPSAPDRAAPSHAPIRRSPEQAPDAALRLAGVEPERLKLVILSHLHWDHCYNLECFPNARFLIQAEELRFAVDPIPTQRGPYEVGVPGLLPSWMPYFDRMEVVRGDVQIAPGISVVTLPGHTPGMQGALVDTAAGRYLLPSDAVPLQDNLGVDGVGLVPPGIHTDVAVSLRSLEKMRAVADVILPSHDPIILMHPIYPSPR
jgi:N-acyl homoserine lactone hydrolase